MVGLGSDEAWYKTGISSHSQQTAAGRLTTAGCEQNSTVPVVPRLETGTAHRARQQQERDDKRQPRQMTADRHLIINNTWLEYASSYYL